MGLRSVLARAAAKRCHVFLVEAVGGAEARMAVEEDIEARGWVQALSPGDADVLCVCGDVPEGGADAVDRLWNQMPGPRTRAAVIHPADARTALAGCVRELLDAGEQRRQEAGRSHEQEQDDGGADSHEGMDHEGGADSHEGMDHEGGADSHEGMDSHGGMDHGGMDHGGMDHGGMDMPMPGGIPLAGEGKDRDGLDLDVLKVQLGPYLPLWPAGLVLHCELQGDVVMGARAAYAFDPGESAATEREPARAALVRRADFAMRLLQLSGAAGEAARVRRVRDQARDGAGLEDISGKLGVSASRIRRNWLLRRTLHGVGRIPQDTGPGDLAGTDAWDRLLGMLDGGVAHAVPATFHAADLFPRLVRGQELSVARLIVASLVVSPAPLPVAGRDAP